jgi:hypothetical protein
MVVTEGAWSGGKAALKENVQRERMRQWGEKGREQRRAEQSCRQDGTPTDAAEGSGPGYQRDRRITRERSGPISNATGRSSKGLREAKEFAR